jgi:replicative DNA helicase
MAEEPAGSDNKSSADAEQGASESEQHADEGAVKDAGGYVDFGSVEDPGIPESDIPFDPAYDATPVTPENQMPAPDPAAPLGAAVTSLRARASGLKVPPHSLDAEQSVLGGLMLDDEAWFNVAEVVGGQDFYRGAHDIIFSAMEDLASDDQPLDAVTVAERLQSKGLLDKAGGLAYLGELADSTPGASNVVAYARGAANRIAESAFNPEGQPSDELLDQAEQAIFAIAEGRLKEGGPERVVPLLSRTVDKVERLYATREPITGIPTGFDDLDKKTAGLQPSDLIIVAGRPSMGKTSVAMNIVEHALMDKDASVLVFSMEMPGEQLVLRMLSSLGRIDQTRLRTGEMHEDDWPRFTSAVSQLKDKKLFIDDTPALSPNDIRTRARRVARETGGLDMIMVDYLQLMRGSGKVENRTNEISEISRSLKAIAKEMRCPVVALSQLNRGLENRTDKRPVMADLRESGAIEQDADVILFVYRDEVYNPESDAAGTAELIIGKQRNGPIGSVRLSFIGNLTKFENLAPDRYADFGPMD